MKLPELSEATGVSARNIKRYIHERLLAPPDGRTRSARYSEVHRRTLLRIESLRAAGFSMDEIRTELQTTRSSPDKLAARNTEPEAGPFVEHRYQIASGVFIVFTSQAAIGSVEAQAEMARRCRASLTS